jgi:hypothetical protein
LSCALSPLNDDADALNNLFRTLNSDAGKKIILIGRHHSGNEDSQFEGVSYDESIAKKSGWTVERVKIKTSQKTGKTRFFVPGIV